MTAHCIRGLDKGWEEKGLAELCRQQIVLGGLYKGWEGKGVGNYVLTPHRIRGIG